MGIESPVVIVARNTFVAGVIGGTVTRNARRSSSRNPNRVPVQLRRLIVGSAALVAVLLVFPASLAANAATIASYSDEIGGTGAANRALTSLLDDAWQGSVSANGGIAQAPAILPSGTITSLPVAADGTTTSVTRARYTTGVSPVYIEPSPLSNQGTGTCVANGGNPPATNLGAGLQNNAPRPTALVGGNGCPNGFAYDVNGGAGESSTRDAVEFEFSRPVLGFGAWFGDLETRTDGQGVAAIVRLYGIGDVLLSDETVEPGPSYLPQSTCGGSHTGCGNNTTRWVGFVADPAAPITRMVVIVGDDDAGGDATREGIGFIGPSFDLSVASISLAKSATPLTDTNADGLIGAGDTISYSFLVTNTGTLAVSSIAITDAAATGLSCPTSVLMPAASTTCTGSHVVTQAEANIGSVTNTATATAAVYGGSIESDPSVHVTTIASTTALTISKIVDVSAYSAVGDILSYDTSVTNESNVTVTAVSVTDSAPGLGAFSTNCGAVNATMQPRDTITCQSIYTVTQADLDDGSVTNVAATSGTVPSGAAIGPFNATAASLAVQVATFDLSKRASEASYNALGDVLHFTITLTNTGNISLTSTSVSDPAPGTGAFTTDCGTVAVALAPGASRTCQAAYTIAAADLATSQLTNVANASAVAASGATLGTIGTQVSVLRGSAALAMTGTSVTLLAFIALALLLGGGVAMRLRHVRFANLPKTDQLEV